MTQLLPIKIAHAFSKNRLSLFAESHLPFLKIAYAIFSPRLTFSPIPWWLRPVAVWDLKTMNDERLMIKG